MRKADVVSMVFVVIGLVFCAPLSSAAPLTPELQAFCDEHLAPVIELYRKGDVEGALERLEEEYVQAEGFYKDGHFFYYEIWKEAQLRTGRDDDEWGFRLFNYLLERDLKKHSDRDRRGPNFALYSNIIERLRDLGRYAQARDFALRLEEGQIRYSAVNTHCSVYEDLGPLLACLPESRKRLFPLRYTDLPNNGGVRNPDRLIWYTNFYGLQNAADLALSIGDWVRAAELSHWYILFADQHMKSDGPRKQEVGGNALDSYRILAELCLKYSHPEEAVALYEEFIEKAEGYYQMQPVAILSAKMSLALIQIQQGRATPDMIALADQADEVISDYKYYSRWGIYSTKLKKVRIYHACGKKEEAWQMLNQLLAEGATHVNPHHRTRMLKTAIDLALEEGGTHPELDQWFVQALEEERQIGDQFGELPLHQKYISFLESQGRSDDALRMKQETERLASSINLLGRTLARQQSSIEPEDPEFATAVSRTRPSKKRDALTKARSLDTVKKRDALSEGVDVQPVSSFSVAPAGQLAYGRFYIYNTASSEQSGQLKLSGKIQSVLQVDDGWVRVKSYPELSETNHVIPVVLAAQGTYVVDLDGQPPEAGPGTYIVCEWQAQDTKQTPVLGEWGYSSLMNDKKMAVRDAHIIQANPLYMVPVSHTIQRRETNATEALDIAVQFSVPARIELYHSETAELIAVDANGDGDFDGPDDQVLCDTNQNKFPDLTFSAGRESASVTMYIQPLEPLNTDQELSFMIMTDGEWRTDAVDVVQPAAESRPGA
jgi:hypothetical protein